VDKALTFVNYQYLTLLALKNAFVLRHIEELYGRKKFERATPKVVQLPHSKEYLQPEPVSISTSLSLF
jgi:hypothetical protein